MAPVLDHPRKNGFSQQRQYIIEDKRFPKNLEIFFAFCNTTIILQKIRKIMYDLSSRLDRIEFNRVARISSIENLFFFLFSSIYFLGSTFPSLNCYISSFLPITEVSRLNHIDFLYKNSPVRLSVTAFDMQKVVRNSGKHTACVEQHELMTHTDVFDPQSFVILLHGVRIEQRIPGAQWLVLFNER
jgi:hypothetical protein